MPFQNASVLWFAFSVLTLLVGWQEGHLACKKQEWWGAGVVVCLQQGADLHTAQLMPLPLTASCFSKIQVGFTFLVLAHLGSPGKRAVKRVCVCVPFQNDPTRCHSTENKLATRHRVTTFQTFCGTPGHVCATHFKHIFLSVLQYTINVTARKIKNNLGYTGNP